MKRIILFSVLALSFNLCRGQSTERDTLALLERLIVLEKANESNETLHLNLDRYQKKRNTSIGFLIGSVVFTSCGFMMKISDTGNSNYLSNVFLTSGYICGITSGAVIFDAGKFITHRKRQKKDPMPNGY